MNKSNIIIVVLLSALCFSYCEDRSSDDADDGDVEIESIPYETPSPRKEGVYFSEHFDNPNDFKKKWIPSQSKKPDADENLAQYDGKWDLGQLDRFPLKNDKGLLMMSPARHSAISARFAKPLRFDANKPVIVQYTVAFQNVHDCGGAYLKLLTEGSVRDLKQFNDKTPYTIMFGPDKCGNNGKIHFIIRHKNPLNGTITEKHCTQLRSEDSLYSDHEPYLLKLVLRPDNRFQFFINNNLNYEGNLLDEDVFNPPIEPPREITDPTDVKPDDWDDRPKIPDPNAVKPDDWDEDEPVEILDEDAIIPDGWLEDELPAIPDPSSEKPTDWDEEMDGEWEPKLIDNPVCRDAPGCGPWSKPTIPNPKYKGKWNPPLLDNPNYKGKWTPRKIPNPDYFEDKAPLRSSPVDAIGFELWSLVNKIYFDDILITDDEDYAEEWSDKTWVLKKRNIAHESKTWFKMFLQYTNAYPWLWGVYVVILAVIVSLIGYCCFRSKFGKDDYAAASTYKKTDEPTDDDPILDDKPVQDEEPSQSVYEEPLTGTSDDVDFSSHSESEKDKESDSAAEPEPVPAARKRKPRKD